MGMQLLFESTTELGGARGHGPARGARWRTLDARGLKVPQIGWNPVGWRRRSALNEGLPDPCAFYHANSFAPRPAHEEDVLGTADYGSEFVSAVAHEAARRHLRGAVPPREVRPGRAARCSANFVRVCARVPA